MPSVHSHHSSLHLTTRGRGFCRFFRFYGPIDITLNDVTRTRKREKKKGETQTIRQFIKIAISSSGLLCGRAGGSASVFILPDPRVANGIDTLSRSQSIVLGCLVHVLLDTHAVVVAPSQIILCIWVTLDNENENVHLSG